MNLKNFKIYQGISAIVCLALAVYFKETVFLLTLFIGGAIGKLDSMFLLDTIQEEKKHDR